MPKAAARLHISQPALHVQVRKLSEQTGVQLYRREGRSLVLTPEGEELAAFGREVQGLGDRVLARVRRRPVQGPVILASGQGAFMYLLGDAIEGFTKRERPLRLLPMSAPDALEAVRSAKAHLAVTVADEPGDLDSIVLREVGQKVVVPKDHPLASQHQVSPAELAGTSLVVAPVGSPHRTMLEFVLKAANAEWEVAVEARGWELMLRFASYGLGLTMVNDFCEVPEGMVGVPLRGAPSVPYRLIWRPRLSDPGALELRELIADAAPSPESP